MIATLRGTVTEKLADIVILETSGIGYGLIMTMEDYGRLAHGQEIHVYIYEHIRENAYDLFGFLHLETKELFERLLSVNGVGPKMAVSVLNIGTAAQVHGAIANGDTKFIQQANGVGKRVAERIIVDLRDKLGLESSGLDIPSSVQSVGRMQQDDAVEALVSLGFTLQDASNALQDIDRTLPVGERVKQALRGNR